MDTTSPGRSERVRDAIAFCAQPPNLRRTLRIALVVGLLLTAVNLGSVIAAGDETVATWIRVGLNFVIPFCVSNAGLLGARH